MSTEQHLKTLKWKEFRFYSFSASVYTELNHQCRFSTKNIKAESRS